MKVLYVAHSLLSRGGDKMVLVHVAHLISCGHEVEIRCNIVNTIFQIPEGVALSQPRFLGVFGSVLGALFEKKDADIVLASIMPMACFLWLRGRRKVVYFAQDDNETFYFGRFKRGLMRICYRVGLGFLKIRTIAVSSWLAESLRSRYGGVISVAPNGVDHSVFFPDPEATLVQKNDEVATILVFARSDQRKGFDLARNLFGRLRDKGLKFVVWTVGDLSCDLGEEVCVKSFGYVGENRLRQLMSSAGLFLYPTRHEGFGLMVLEAFACGCPVVTTDAVKFAVHGQNSLVASTDSCDELVAYVESCLTDHVLREVLVGGGYETAEAYSLTAGMAKFITLLESYRQEFGR